MVSLLLFFPLLVGIGAMESASKARQSTYNHLKPKVGISRRAESTFCLQTYFERARRQILGPPNQSALAQWRDRPKRAGLSRYIPWTGRKSNDARARPIHNIILAFLALDLTIFRVQQNCQGIFCPSHLCEADEFDSKRCPRMASVGA